jgi:predicted nucleic acid-binding protein
LFRIVDELLAVDRSIVERAQEFVFGQPHLSARDAVHLAVMERHGIERILSFDSDFDGVPGIARLY